MLGCPKLFVMRMRKFNVVFYGGYISGSKSEFGEFEFVLRAYKRGFLKCVYDLND